MSPPADISRLFYPEIRYKILEALSLKGPLTKVQLCAITGAKESVLDIHLAFFMGEDYLTRDKSGTYRIKTELKKGAALVRIFQVFCASEPEA